MDVSLPSAFLKSSIVPAVWYLVKDGYKIQVLVKVWFLTLGYLLVIIL